MTITANLVLDYYSGQDLYCDGDVESRIMEFVQNNYDLENLDENTTAAEHFAFIYHLSEVRENILNWYPFKRDCRILEVGSGCGAITGLLCQKAGYVTSVELSKDRAAINYERHKDLENLEIVVGNLNNLIPHSDYDYVILNGVLEYACSYTKGEKPFETFLKNIKKYLKKKGKLIVAIENRMGLKYFAGAPEDHTDQCFWGIKKYPFDNTVKTFSKAELEELLKQAGYPYMSFYYPYPDYKFPTEIFTDSNINSGQYGKAGIYVEKCNKRLFDEKSVADSLAKEKILDKFANSFLIEASDTNFQKTNVVYVKLNSIRKKKFALGTVITQNKLGSRKVFKWPLCKEAIQHLTNTFENGQKNASNLIGKYKVNYIEYPFLHATTLADYIKNVPIFERGKKLAQTAEEVVTIATGEVEEKYDFYTESFKEMFGGEKINKEMKCVIDPNIDLILDNIFLTSQGYVFIDCEWYVKGYIPRNFIVWRIINEMYNQDEELRSTYGFEVLLKYVSISKKEDYLFRSWSNHFAEKYVQQNYVRKYQKSNEVLDITEQIQGTQQITTNVYIDSGQGFSEAEKLCLPLILSKEGDFDVTFKLSAWERIRSIRWDPIEQEIVKCENIHFFLDGQEVYFYGKYEEEVPGLFITMDPQYFYSGDPAKYQELHISGKMLQMKEGQVLISVYEKDFKPLFEKNVRYKQ